MSTFHLIAAFFATAVLSSDANAAPQLSAWTSDLKTSSFVTGSNAELTVQASGFAANERRDLSIDIRDWRDAPVRMVRESFTADAKGGWQGSFRLPTDRFGCFRVYVKSGDVALMKRGSRPAGLLTYMVTHGPRPSSASDAETFFGAYGSTDDMCVKAMGLRHGFGSCNPHVYLYKLLLYDMYRFGKEYWTEEGLAWARESYGRKRTGCVQEMLTDPVGERHMRHAIASMMRAVKARKSPGEHLVWEPGSEVDLLFPDPKLAVKMARVMRELVDQEDPGGRICFPGVSNVRDVNYHRQIIELGILDHLNAFSLHPYTAFPPEPNGFLANIRTIRQLIRDRLGHDLPMYSTEQGFALPGTVEGERKKLEGQLRVNLMLLGEGFDKSYSFFSVDFGNDDHRDVDGDYGLFFNLRLNEKTPKGPDGASPRAVAAGLAAAAWYLDGKRPTACLEGVFGENTLGYSYADGSNNCAIALWDFGGKTSEARLSVGRAEIRVADVMGNERLVRTENGVLPVTLEGTPVYVLDPDPALWGHGGTAAAELAAESRRRAAEREARIKLKIHGVEPAFAGETAAVAVDVENRTDAKRTVEVETRIVGEPFARRKVAVGMAAKERRVVRVPLAEFTPDPTVVRKLKTTVSLKDDYYAEREDEINFWKAERIAGSVAEWTPRRRYDIGRKMGLDRMEVPTPDDLSAAFAFGWTDEFLVGDVVVTDERHYNDRQGFMSWRGDSIQMGFARQALEKMTENNLTDMALQAPSEYTFALTPKGPEVYRTITFDLKAFPSDHNGAGQVPLAEAPTTVVRDGTRTLYRFQVPWRFLNVKRPIAGQTVRISSFVNDVDDETLSHPVTMIKLFELKQSVPHRFGRLVLGE